MPEGVRLQNNITQSVRSKDRVDYVQYVALNNLFSADFETASKGKRIYKHGAKLYQVERLVSKRKSLLVRGLILGLFGHIDRGSNH